MSVPVSAEIAKEIRAHQDRYEATLAARGDMSDLFTEDAIYQYSGVPLVMGRSAIQKMYDSLYSTLPRSADPNNDMYIKMTSTTGPFCDAASAGHPKLVIDVGTAFGKGPAPTGGMMELYQLYTVIYIKVHQKWKVKVAAIDLVGDQSGKYPDYLRKALSISP